MLMMTPALAMAGYWLCARGHRAKTAIGTDPPRTKSGTKFSQNTFYTLSHYMDVLYDKLKVDLRWEFSVEILNYSAIVARSSSRYHLPTMI